ncbi:MAG: hypothetical protein ACK4GQ_03660 [Candidatus Hadarchaeales archaeon]
MAIVLCCGKKGCTKIEFKEDGVEISGEGTAKIAREEWNLLVEKIAAGELGKI